MVTRPHGQGIFPVSLALGGFDHCIMDWWGGKSSVQILGILHLRVFVIARIWTQVVNEKWENVFVMSLLVAYGLGWRMFSSISRPRFQSSSDTLLTSSINIT